MIFVGLSRHDAERLVDWLRCEEGSEDDAWLTRMAERIENEIPSEPPHIPTGSSGETRKAP